MQKATTTEVPEGFSEMGVREGDRVYGYRPDGAGELTLRIVRGLRGEEAESFLADLNRALDRPKERPCQTIEPEAGRS
jgi:hypothetical protein